MSASREELSKRIKSARQWLEKAEVSLGQDSGVRGELNLLLAQAEMQKLRETHKGLLVLTERKTWWGLLILFTAFIFFAIGFGHSALAPSKSENAYTLPTSVSVTSRDSLPMNKVRLEKDLETRANTVHSSTSIVLSEPVDSQDTPVQMSNADLHALVSDAGKVLRGRE